MPRSSNKREREESSEEDLELGQKRLRPLPSENRVIESKINEGRTSRILDFYTFGANDNSQLGVSGGQSDELKPLKAISDLNCLSFTCSKDSCFVMEGNQNARYRNVYSWGGDGEALGREVDDSDNAPAPIEALAQQPMVQIAAGGSHVVALTSTGEVISWGIYKDRKGNALGFKSNMPKEEWMETPDLIEELQDFKIVQVAAARTRSIALTETGEVYEWGETRLDDRTLDRHKQESLSPAQVLINSKIVAVYAEGNGDTVFAEDIHGKVFAWGQNNYYQCGIDAEVVASTKVKDRATAEKNREAKRKKLATHSRAAKAKQINQVLEENADQVAKISCGRVHSVLLTKNGDVYTWGSNKFGVLGLGLDENAEVAVPTKINLGKKVKAVDISCGAFHTLVVTDKGEVLGFGKNKNNCLSDASETQNTPAKLKVAPKKGKIVGVACGARHNLVAAVRE